MPSLVIRNPLHAVAIPGIWALLASVSIWAVQTGNLMMTVS
jgi:ABC-type uncharacterized transport system permease subunit